MITLMLSLLIRHYGGSNGDLIITNLTTNNQSNHTFPQITRLGVMRMIDNI